MLEKWHTNNTNLGQHRRIGMYIIMTAGRPVDWCSRRALISSAFPYFIYTAYRFLRGNLCLVVRRFLGLLGQFTTVISLGRTGGKRLTSSPGLSDPKRTGRPEKWGLETRQGKFVSPFPQPECKNNPLVRYAMPNLVPHFSERQSEIWGRDY